MREYLVEYDPEAEIDLILLRNWLIEIGSFGHALEYLRKLLCGEPDGLRSGLSSYTLVRLQIAIFIHFAWQFPYLVKIFSVLPYWRI